MERKILPPGRLYTLFRRKAREPNVVLRKLLTGFSYSYLLEARGLAVVPITYFTLAFCGLSVLASLYYSAHSVQYWKPFLASNVSSLHYAVMPEKNS